MAQADSGKALVAVPSVEARLDFVRRLIARWPDIPDYGKTDWLMGALDGFLSIRN